MTPSASSMTPLGTSTSTSHSNRSTSDQPDATQSTPAAGVPAPTAASSAELAHLAVKLREALRQFPDFPSPGVLFEDILPIFADPILHDSLLRALELQVRTAFGEHDRPDVIVALDARGFLFGPGLALRLGAGFVPVRKQGKLPGPTVSARFRKEYGEDVFEIQRDTIRPGQKVLVVDDIIATGGSAAAAGSLVESAKAHLVGYLFILELDFLKGRQTLHAPVHTLLSGQAEPSVPPE
ncbi:MAG: adenine phosphoribosyltransferase [Lichina confinis]|nr:MAG: adenine phosphoribosyltransferase [Lichina confinis]